MFSLSHQCFQARTLCRKKLVVDFHSVHMDQVQPTHILAFGFSNCFYHLFTTWNGIHLCLDEICSCCIGLSLSALSLPCVLGNTLPFVP